jgi:hypothetical protein
METFLVRVWVPSEEPASDATLHGLAQHVRSGRATAFTEGEQLCSWLGVMAAEQGGAGGHRTAAVGKGGRAEDGL